MPKPAKAAIKIPAVIASKPRSHPNDPTPHPGEVLLRPDQYFDASPHGRWKSALERIAEAGLIEWNGGPAILLAELAYRMIEHQPLHSARVARMRLRGAQRFASLIERHGGSYRVREVADLMGTSEAAVRKALQRRRLVAFKQDGEWRLPVWQFAADDRPLPGLARVLAALPADLGDRDVIRFLLLGPEGDPASSPLERL